MKLARKAAAVLTAAVLICMMLATVAFADGSGSMWLETEQAGGTVALVITDTTVTDGLIKLTYDSAALTYEGIEVTQAYVAMHAVNAEEDGVILISWVAPSAYELEEETACLFKLSFSGTGKSAMSLTGEALDADENPVTIVSPSAEEEDSGATEGEDTTEGTGSTGGTQDDDKESADTGDASQVMIFAGMGLVSAMCMAVLLTGPMMKKGRYAK